MSPLPCPDLHPALLQHARSRFIISAHMHSVAHSHFVLENLHGGGGGFFSSIEAVSVLVLTQTHTSKSIIIQVNASNQNKHGNLPVHYIRLVRG